DVREFLSSWSTGHNVPHNTVNSLLRYLRQHACFSSLPMDARTLLKTPRGAKLRDCPPGKYCHFSLKQVLEEIISTSPNLSEIPSQIGLMFYVDGVQVSKSSKSQFWPILAQSKDLSDAGIFVIGCYHGYSKPASVHDYLKDFVEELLQLIENGFEVSGRDFGVAIKAFVCDAPARAFLLGIKSHSGYFGCGKCVQKGSNVENRVVFLKTDAALRTDQDFIDKSQPDHHLTDTPLSLLPMGLVSQFPYEYMHLVCLGVVRKLLLLWMRGSIPKCRLASKVIHEISQSLLRLAAEVCCEFSRKPLSLSEIDRWKATELRQFLLYTGPVVLKALERKKQEHFLVLHVAISLLATPELCHQQNDYAQELLLFFVRCFPALYGKETVSYNVHGLVHLAGDVLMHGPLDEFSAFDSESFLCRLKRLVRSGRKPLEQLFNRISELRVRNPKCQRSSDIDLQMKHSDGPLVEGCLGPQYRKACLENFVLTTSSGDNCCILEDSSIVAIENFSRDAAGKEVLIARQYLKMHDLYSVPCRSSVLGIHVVSQPSVLKMWPLIHVQNKCVRLPLHSDPIEEFAVFPLRHSCFRQ
ncbi:unnamed protein product, partial [Ixodes hexagonus]